MQVLHGLIIIIVIFCPIQHSKYFQLITGIMRLPPHCVIFIICSSAAAKGFIIHHRADICVSYGIIIIYTIFYFYDLCSESSWVPCTIKPIFFAAGILKFYFIIISYIAHSIGKTKSATIIKANDYRRSTGKRSAISIVC